MLRCARSILPGLLLLLAVPALAAPPAPAAPAPTIAASSAASEDSAIARRIRGIFREIDGLSGISVKVSSGVVTLGGKVADPRDIDRAEQVAARVSGVVTVENTVTRDVAVQNNLNPALGGLRAKADEVLATLPLIGVAALVAIIIGFIGYLIAGFSRLWQRITPNVFLAELIATAIRFVFVVGGIVIGLEIIGATALLGAVLGGAGVIGVALGFAVRDTIDNYVSSLMLSLRQPFRANDHVVIEDKEGRVVRLTSRATVLMTLDGNHLRIPNATVFKAVILNYTRNPQRRFEFDLGVDADDDPTQAAALGVAVMRTLDFVLASPEPTARIIEVGDSNIVLRFLGWIDQTQTDYFKARTRAIPAVKEALEAAGFALPEPIYRLRFDEGAPLPLASRTGVDVMPEASEDQPRRPAKPKTQASEREMAEIGDTAPETHIEKMVAEERASDADQDDLLDSGRPVE